MTVPDPRWEACAAREPYFSVLTSPQFLRANLTTEREREFFESGEELVDWMLRTIELRLAPAFAPVSSLEYGCGVGRLAIPLARRPGSVVAVDRSPTMLDLARRAAERHGVAHVDFRTPAELFAVPRKFDLVTCYLVLQRVPQDEGLTLLRALVGRLGSGGIGVFHVPCRTTTSRLVETSRWLRARVPGINGLANILRRKPFGEPFWPSHAYDLHEVFGVLDESSIAAMHVTFEHQEGLDSAIIFAQAPELFTAAAAQATNVPEREIDVRQMIAGTPLADLNRRAEDYFASLTDWDHHLAKPFSAVEETPRLLMDVALMLQGLRLVPGATVLEFGAGTGWLSRFLTQLGCRVILLDVSATGLRIARKLYERLPIIGDQPQPEFLQFGGHHIDLPDASVERIVSFHAFHHVPNPDAVLREFGRILKAGGIVAFVEPGPRHSRVPMSQFEMRMYGVVENDMDVHALWRIAQTCGFNDLKLAVFHGPPFHVSLEDYEDFLTGGPTGARWVESARFFLRHVRTFFLFKEGSEPSDSRTVNGLACRIHATCSSVPAGHPLVVEATVTNTGSAIWRASNELAGGVSLGAHLYDGAGKLLHFDVCRGNLTAPSREIAPGETVQCHIVVPPQTSGQYLLELDCVADHVTWFAQVGLGQAMVPVEVVGAGA